VDPPVAKPCIHGGFVTDVVVYARHQATVFFLSLEAGQVGVGATNEYGDVVAARHYPTITMALRAFVGLMKRGDDMDTGEGRRILSEHLAKYRAMPYADLAARVGKVETFEVPRQGRRPWQVEVVFHWDGEPDGNVRVIAAIDDGGLRAFLPLSDSFIKSRSGEFIGE
jgi:hypothetical protein